MTSRNASFWRRRWRSRSGHKVEIAAPQRGEKRELVEHALANAREALGRKLAEAASQQRLLAALAETFALPRPPRRIEVYDNSHIQGSNAVGAMIVAGPEGFAKKEYRKFNIRSADLVPGDDFGGMMREVLGRRFKRLVNETARSGSSRKRSDSHWRRFNVRRAGDPDPRPGLRPAAEEDGVHRAFADTIVDTSNEQENAPPWPDLVLIDGGEGQLGAARKVLSALGIDGVPLVGIAKGPDRDAGRETFYMPGRAPFRLPPRDPVLYFVQRLRDEDRIALRSDRPPRPPQPRHPRGWPAGDRGDRPDPETRCCAPFRHAQGHRAGLDRRLEQSSGRQRRNRPPHL